MKILTVVGNRPQFVKAAAVSGPLRAAHDEVLVHTGQHYDDSLSDIFFRELGLERPERELGIGGGSNTSQTARMLAAIEPLLGEEAPDAVLVYGDTNSTLAGALAAAQARVPVVHIEAGMRSFDLGMPEELNRLLTDHMSALLLCSSHVGAQNLARESVAGWVEVVGDVMVNVALKWQPRASASAADAAERLGLDPGGYVLVTAHRAGNVDDPARLRRLVALLRAVADGTPARSGGEGTSARNAVEGTPVLFPLHPRTRERLHATAGESGGSSLWEELLAGANNIHVTEPLGYTEFTALLYGARAVLTDSGGVQKEAYLAAVPCVTLRDSTEWIETVETGWNALVDLDADAVLEALGRQAPVRHPPLYGDGRAAERCVAAIGALGVGGGRA